MKTVCLINGSLRGRKASSLQFLNDINRRLPAQYVKTSVTVRARQKGAYPEETLKVIGGADAIVLVFPLYTYALPGALMKLLEDYQRFVEAGNATTPRARVYAVINCAFPRPDMTSKEAVRVIRNFCRRLSLDWRFAICIGTGPVVVVTRKIPFLDLKLKRAYRAIASDLERADTCNVSDCFVKPVIPEILIRKIKERYEQKGRMYGEQVTRSAGGR